MQVSIEPYRFNAVLKTTNIVDRPYADKSVALPQTKAVLRTYSLEGQQMYATTLKIMLAINEASFMRSAADTHPGALPPR